MLTYMQIDHLTKWQYSTKKCIWSHALSIWWCDREHLNDALCCADPKVEQYKPDGLHTCTSSIHEYYVQSYVIMRISYLPYEGITTAWARQQIPIKTTAKLSELQYHHYGTCTGLCLWYRVCVHVAISTCIITSKTITTYHFLIANIPSSC